MRVVTIGALLGFCACWPAAACVPEASWVPLLPNETAKQHADRRDQAHRDRAVIWEHDRQQSLVESASGFFLGEVVTSTVMPEGRRIASVKPLLAVKGTLPVQPVRLENYSLPGCVPFPAIDGEGALGEEGDLVFVFTGLEVHPKLRPRGIDSLMTRRILNETLVEALRTYGLEDPGE